LPYQAGCSVVKTNLTHTSCACSKQGLFAVVGKEKVIDTSFSLIVNDTFKTTTMTIIILAMTMMKMPTTTMMTYFDDQDHDDNNDDNNHDDADDDDHW